MSSNDWDLFKEELRARCDIADVVSVYVPLKRAGTTLKGLCPFHREKTPSFNVDPRRQMFHCFGCGAGGDVFAFVQNIEKTDFLGALQLLARKAGMEDRIPRGGGGGGGPPGEREKLFEIHDQLASHYHELLMKAPEAQPARDYLLRREIPEAVWKAWRIGYAPNRYDAVINWGKQKGHDLKLLIAAGVVATRDEDSDRAGQPYDRFRGRVMFTICDATGRVVAFSGRILDPNASPAKYMNSPETLIFKKSLILFAIDKARERLIDTKQALLCEGQIDVIRCHMGGFTNAVAAQGTALTEEHIRLLKRYNVDEVVLVPDADNAGQRAARRALDLVLRAGMLPKVAILPDDEDPDTLIQKHGPAAMQEALSGALSGMEYAFQTMAVTEDTQSPAGRMRLARGLAALIRQAPSQVMQETLIAEAADRLGVSPESLAADVAAAPSPAAASREEAAPEPARAQVAPAAPPPDGADCRLLLELLIHHPSFIPEFLWILEKLHPSAPDQAAILQTMLRYRPDQHPEWHHYLPEDPPEARGLAASLIMHAKPLGKELGDPHSAVTMTLMALCRQKIEHAVKQASLQVRLAEDPSARIVLENREMQLSYALGTLKTCHRTQNWQKAIGVLEAYQDEL